MGTFGWVLIAGAFLVLIMVANNSWPWVWAKISAGMPQPGQGNPIVPTPAEGTNPFTLTPDTTQQGPPSGTIVPTPSSPGVFTPPSFPNQGGVSGSDIVNSAQSQVGKAYSYGAAVNTSLQQLAYDCSSLVASVFGAAGISLPRTSQQQAQSVTKTNTPSPGDLVFGSFQSLNDHVGIYLGGGKVVSALDEAHGVLDTAANWPDMWFGHVSGVSNG